MEVITKNAEETKKFGRKIADNIGTGQEALDNRARILALSGNLGSGKTTFVQGLAEGLGIKQRIISPTFIIMRQYRVKPKEKGQKSGLFCHVDLYRLEDNIEAEMENLGMDEIFGNPKNIVAIEWAEKAREYLPDDTIWLKFDNLGGEKRRIEVN